MLSSLFSNVRDLSFLDPVVCTDQRCMRCVLPSYCVECESGYETIGGAACQR